jgi:hypothetical protein
MTHELTGRSLMEILPQVASILYEMKAKMGAIKLQRVFGTVLTDTAGHGFHALKNQSREEDWRQKRAKNLLLRVFCKTGERQKRDSFKMWRDVILRFNGIETGFLQGVLDIENKLYADIGSQDLSTFAKEHEMHLKALLKLLGAAHSAISLAFISKGEQYATYFVKGRRVEASFHESSILKEVVTARRKFVCRQPFRFVRSAVDQIPNFTFENQLPVMMTIDEPNDDMTESEGDLIEISNQFYGAFPVVDRLSEKIKIVVRIAVHSKDPIVSQTVNFLMGLARQPLLESFQRFKQSLKLISGLRLKAAESPRSSVKDQSSLQTSHLRAIQIVDEPEKVTHPTCIEAIKCL